jgi:hypothetical protein
MTTLPKTDSLTFIWVQTSSFRAPFEALVSPHGRAPLQRLVHLQQARDGVERAQRVHAQEDGERDGQCGLVHVEPVLALAEAHELEREALRPHECTRHNAKLRNSYPNNYRLKKSHATPYVPLI